MTKFILILLTAFAFTAFGQTDQEKAYDYGMKAIEEMEAGNSDVAIKLLKKAKKLAPDDINYPYEISYAHYLANDYSKAIKVLEGLKNHNSINEKIYQMLGNCYDMNKEPIKAIESYEKGLEFFPNSGILYTERGNMELMQEHYSEALSYYEKGIEVQPTHSSNYYRAAKIYLNTTDEMWGMIYGEIFMNIERNSKRTQEISKMLFDTYKSEIKFTSDSSFSVSFSQNHTISIEDLADTNAFKLPFGLLIYEPGIMMSMINEKSITLSSLNRMRTNFVDFYFDGNHQETYPNVLFDFQKKIKELGHIEAYNHWLLMMGDEEEFAAWLEGNTEKWEDFIAWFSENPIEVNESNKFFRAQY